MQPLRGMSQPSAHHEVAKRLCRPFQWGTWLAANEPPTDIALLDRARRQPTCHHRKARQMINRSILALAIVLTFSGLAWAQPGPEVGTYDMEWSILHVPVSSDLPDLQTGTVTIQLERVMPGDCPPSSAFIVRNAPKFSLAGDATTIWCIKPDGGFDTSAGTMSSGGWFQYTHDVAYVDGKNTRANDTTNAVARQQATP